MVGVVRILWIHPPHGHVFFGILLCGVHDVTIVPQVEDGLNEDRLFDSIGRHQFEQHFGVEFVGARWVLRVGPWKGRVLGPDMDVGVDYAHG